MSLTEKGQIKASGGSTSSMTPPIKTPNMHVLINPSRGEALAAPPGFPPLFPELSPADQKMAMLYISHSDETERNARILRVRQGIEDNRESSLRLIRITNEIDKGKGHVFHYTEKSIYQEDSSKRFRVGPQLLLGNTEDEAESSANAPDTLSAPAFVSSGFQLRPTLEGRASGNLSLGKAARNRPPSWKRKANPKKGNSAFGPALKGQEQSAANGTKRKQSVSASAVDNKSPKYTESSVASVLKPLQPQ